MSSLKLLNQDAEHAKRFVALAMNINAAKGLQEVLKTNLGPKVIAVPTLHVNTFFLSDDI
jgi:chaperonin GroEL (HSP60 family)